MHALKVAEAEPMFHIFCNLIIWREGESSTSFMFSTLLHSKKLVSNTSGKFYGTRKYLLRQAPVSGYTVASIAIQNQNNAELRVPSKCTGLLLL
jgi:hypothetical protein